MKISKVIKELKTVENTFGDIEVQLQDDPLAGKLVVGFPTFFIVPEKYSEGYICNLRWWPY